MDKKHKMILNPEQKQQLSKYGVFALMFVVFGLSLWFIFKPSGNKKKQTQNGLNTELPLPQEEGLLKDKLSAFEQSVLHQQNPVRSLEEFSSLIENEEPKKMNLLQTDDKKENALGKYSGSKEPERAIQSSATAYNNINRTLGNFYERPKPTSETEQLKKEVEELRQQLMESKQDNKVDDHLVLMEKSYQLAAKYMPKTSTAEQEESDRTIAFSEPKKEPEDKSAIVFVSSSSTVSALQQGIGDTLFSAGSSKAYHRSFFTFGDKRENSKRNTIKACVNGTQKLVNGQNVQLRLLESIETGGVLFPRNSLISGIAQLQGERLQVTISSLEQNGRIIPVQLYAYDLDGQAGLFIPGSIEASAIKEVSSAMGRDAGTSININQGTSAGEQLAADVGRSFIQGTSKYVSKKLGVTKVTLKAGHKLLLMSAQ